MTGALAYYAGRRLKKFNKPGASVLQPLAVLATLSRGAPVLPRQRDLRAVSYALFARGSCVTRAASLEDAQPKPEIKLNSTQSSNDASATKNSNPARMLQHKQETSLCVFPFVFIE